MSVNTYSTLPLGKQLSKGHSAFQFSVLTCQKPLYATKIINADGKETNSIKPKFFFFHYSEIDSIEDFEKLVLTWLYNEPRRFIIYGQLLTGLDPAKRHYRRILGHRKEPPSIECPLRRWLVLDLDGVEVPNGWGAPDKLAEAAYFIRDNKLPPYFRGVRSVAAATSSTGRKGPGIARLRLFFVLSHPASIDALYSWADSLSHSRPDLGLDPRVLQPMQPIYTARPIFRGMTDPVPVWGRVRLLDGYTDEVELELPRARKRKEREPKANVVCNDAPEWMLDPAERDAGLGIHTFDTSDKAWMAIKRIFENLDGCGAAPKIGARGRFETIRKSAWELAHLVHDGEISQQLAREAFLRAAEGIHNGDGKYNDIEDRWQSAIDDVGGVL
ncbi:MAG: hypothetical protein C5B54_04160 [Acidobacteria bacterium]|nr:MAG: hypothetical protein C5B54_04160 [Acidobacteriota bacterium]